MSNPPEDSSFDPEELDAAANDLPAGIHAPEVSDSTEKLTEWDEVPDASGHCVERVPLEDEEDPVQQLVDEGLEEADSEQRIAAADPDLEAS